MGDEVLPWYAKKVSIIWNKFRINLMVFSDGTFFTIFEVTCFVWCIIKTG